MADNAGALLVRAGLIGEDQLLVARQHAAARGGTVGEHLVLNGFIDDDELTRFFHKRMMVPRVDPNQLARISTRMIRKVPADMAAEFRIVPVALDREQNLTVVMSDPSNTHAVDELGFFTGCYVMRAVATQRQIAWCLAHYYGHVTPLGETLLQPAQEEGAQQASGATARVSAEPTGGREQTKPSPVQNARAAPAETPTDGVPQTVDEGAPVSVTGKVEAARRPVRPPIPADEDPEEDIEEGIEVTIEAHEPPAPDRAAGGTISDGWRLEPRPEAPERKPDRRVPSVSFGEETTSPTGPMRVLKNVPPELSPKAGEVRVRTESDATPLLQDRDLPAVVVEEHRQTKSEPILLQRPSRDSSQPPEGEVAPPSEGEEREPDDGQEQDDATPVLVLSQPKRARARRSTNVGLGHLSSSPAIRRPTTEELEADAAAEEHPQDELTPPSTPRARSARAARSSPTDTIQDPVPRATEDDETERNPTGKFQRIDYADVDDDGFGPPGSTIPPAFLGAMPDSEERTNSDAIPLLLDSSGITGRVASPAQGKGKTKDVADLAATLEAAAEAQRALEASSQKLIETLRRLDTAHTRDQVIDILLDHLIETFACVSFFVVKSGKLCSFRCKGIGEQEINQRKAELLLDRPSTFQDVVSSRLSFNGPLRDEPSRAFVTELLGADPGEILAMPCAVRDRVVGVLFGNQRRNKRIIQEHVAVVLRAAGQALERIVRTRKGSVPGTEPAR